MGMGDADGKAGREECILGGPSLPGRQVPAGKGTEGKKLYIDTALPFDLRSASKIFNNL